MDPVLFYSPRETPYGCFSNFSRHSLTFEGRTWRTSEAPFQAMKFFPHRMDLVDQIHRAATPMETATLGRDPSNPIREDWDKLLSPTEIPLEDNIVDDGRGPAKVIERVKDWVMYRVVFAKFSQSLDCQGVLLGTGSRPLIENAIHDPYWGWGSSRTGVNRLGKIHMAVRRVLR
jgi:N-glycosidase YbiA